MKQKMSCLTHNYAHNDGIACFMLTSCVLLCVFVNDANIRGILLPYTTKEENCLDSKISIISNIIRKTKCIFLWKY